MCRVWGVQKQFVRVTESYGTGGKRAAGAKLPIKVIFWWRWCNMMHPLWSEICWSILNIFKYFVIILIVSTNYIFVYLLGNEVFLIVFNILVADWPRRKAVAEFRLCVGHDCLGTHLHRTGIRPDPYCMLCSLREPMDRNHLGQCTALLKRTECERYWEARIKMMENWLCLFYYYYFYDYSLSLGLSYLLWMFLVSIL